MSTTKERLQKLLKIRYEEQLRFFETLTEEERTGVGSADAWSPKDVMAHVVESDALLADWFIDPEGQEFDEEEDYEAINARTWEKYQDTPWEEIDALAGEFYGKLVGVVQGFTEEGLNDPENQVTPGRPLWRIINFVAFYHPLQHIAELVAKRGDVAYGNKLQEEAVDLQMALSDEDEWRGSVIYNLGCHYALTEQRDKALEKIRQGIELKPELKELAAKDPDLKAIQDDPEFKALIG
jgi:hypothetical protein